MKLTLQRIKQNEEATLGVLYIDGEAECFTLEDQFQAVKVPGETRIPEGEYEIKLRNFGGHHKQYANLYPNIHKGMLWIQDVPEFEDILIHTGNTDEDTKGCILVGGIIPYQMDNLLYVGESRIAYKKMYVKVVEALEKGEKVTITIL